MTIRLMTGSPSSETQTCQSVFSPRKARCRQRGLADDAPPHDEAGRDLRQSRRREVVAQQRGERRGEAERVPHRAEEIVELSRRRPAGVDVFPAVQEREGLPVVPAAGGPLLALEHVPEAVRATDGDLERPGELYLLAGRQRGVLRHLGAEGEALRPADALQGRLEVRAASGSIAGFLRAGNRHARHDRERQAGGEERAGHSFSRHRFLLKVYGFWMKPASPLPETSASPPSRCTRSI